MLDTSRAIRNHIRFGVGAIMLLVGASTAWSFVAKLDSAVVTQGTVVVESSIKKVQHPTGGVVGEILVKEGQRVKAGDIVMRLDQTVTRSNQQIVMNDLQAVRARVARLLAERNDETAVDFPSDLLARTSSDPIINSIVEGEKEVFATRLTTRQGQKAQLRERIGQFKDELQGAADQKRSLNIQLDVARSELAQLRSLLKRGLTTRPRVTALEREVARNDGQLGEVSAGISSVRGKIAETELQILQLDKDHANEVAKELRESETRMNELMERRTAAEDQLKRVDIRAPIDGVVHEMSVHTVGGVVNPTEPIMNIVPDAEKLVLEIRIQPIDIDQVHTGLPTRVRFTAFNQRTTPEVMGTVTRIAADSTKDPQTGQSYFTGAVEIEEGEITTKLAHLKLLPGMPADAFIRTGQRTFASYITKPLTDQMQRAMRER